MESNHCMQKQITVLKEIFIYIVYFLFFLASYTITGFLGDFFTGDSSIIIGVPFGGETLDLGLSSGYFGDSFAVGEKFGCGLTALFGDG